MASTFTTDKSGKILLNGKPFTGDAVDKDGKTHTLKNGVEVVPKPKVTGAAATGDTSQTDSLNFGTLGGGNQQKSGWTGAAAATFSTGGFIPGKPSMTGDEVLQAFNALAADNSPTWSTFRDVLKNTIPGYNLKDLKSNWTSQDVSAIKNFLVTLNNRNTTFQGTDKGTLNIVAFANQTLANAKKTGSSFSTLNSTSTTTPLIPIPSTADLMGDATTAFTKKLGRTPTQAEATDFAKKYQDLVLSYGNAKVSAKKNAAFEAPAQPISFQQQGTPASATMVKNPVAATNAIMQPPTSSTAAENFATRKSPTEASAQAAADGLNQFLTMLKG